MAEYKYMIDWLPSGLGWQGPGTSDCALPPPMGVTIAESNPPSSRPGGLIGHMWSCSWTLAPGLLYKEHNLPVPGIDMQHHYTPSQTGRELPTLTLSNGWRSHCCFSNRQLSPGHYLITVRLYAITKRHEAAVGCGNEGTPAAPESGISLWACC
jgi:hypothetical protein